MKVSSWAISQNLAKRNRIPCWLSPREIEQIGFYYKAARRLTKLTGVKYVVDHIVPLRGRFVSGLHVPSNLQIISQLDNAIKSNKFGEG